MNRLGLLLLLILVGCGYNRFEAVPPSEPVAWKATASIGALTEGRVAQTVVVEGVVTTSDSTGNFYKELLVENQGVLRIAVGMYDLCALYRRGTTIAVEIEAGSLLERAKEGVLSLSLAANFNALGQKLHRQPYALPWEIAVVTLAEFSRVAPGSTVRIERVRFVQGGTGALFSGEATLEQGRATAQLLTSPYALFADQKLPDGWFDLVAVVVDGKLKISDPATDLILW